MDPFTYSVRTTGRFVLASSEWIFEFDILPFLGGEKLKKYLKMFKIGLRESQIKHKMRPDGLDADKNG